MLKSNVYGRGYYRIAQGNFIFRSDQGDWVERA